MSLRNNKGRNDAFQLPDVRVTAVEVGLWVCGYETLVVISQLFSAPRPLWRCWFCVVFTFLSEESLRGCSCCCSNAGIRSLLRDNRELISRHLPSLLNHPKYSNICSVGIENICSCHQSCHLCMLFVAPAARTQKWVCLWETYFAWAQRGKRHVCSWN